MYDSDVNMSRRIEKVNELLRQEVGKLIKRVVDDPELGFVTVTGAKTSSDLCSAKIYVSVYGKNPKKSISVLRRYSYEIQRILNKELRMRFVPRISFYLDETEKNAAKIEKLFNKIHRDEKKP